jgi:DNA-binding IclR family transcriptional regulator
MVSVYFVAFIKRAKNRNTILQLLAEKKRTQAELHHESKMYRTHVRRTLIELQKRKLVKCLNPKDRIYKIYQITNLGKEVLEEIK